MKKTLNIIKFSTIKRFCIILILLVLFIFVSALSYVTAVSNNISDSLFRLHVIANSDSKEDRNLKYLVRDDLIEYMNSICENCTSKSEVISLANAHLNDFENIAKKVISENGFNYDVSVEIGNFEFPTKTYGDISLPSGYYDALRVKIGEAKGQNWWCVMFPPLCFVDVSSGIVPDESKKQMQESMPEEEYSLISNTDDSEINFKFKLVEFFENIKFMAQK